LNDSVGSHRFCGPGFRETVSTAVSEVRDVHLECQSIYKPCPFCRSPHCLHQAVSRSRTGSLNGSPQLFSPLSSCATLLKVWHRRTITITAKRARISLQQSRAQCCTHSPFTNYQRKLFVAVFPAGERSSRECYDIPSRSLFLFRYLRLWRQVALDTAALWIDIRIHDLRRECQSDHFASMYLERSKSSLWISAITLWMVIQLKHDQESVPTHSSSATPHDLVEGLQHTQVAMDVFKTCCSDLESLRVSL